MTKIFSLSSILILISLMHVNAQDITIANEHNISLNKDYTLTEGYIHSGFALDTQGNKIVVGSFDGKDVAFDNSNILTSYKSKNIFIAKYNNSNEIIWMKNIGGSYQGAYRTFSDFAVDVKVDNLNNIYVVSVVDNSTNDIVDFDPEHPNTNSIISISTEISFIANGDIFITKYSPDGTLVWMKRICDEFYDTAFHLTLDNNNNVWVTGSIAGHTGNTVDFDPDNVHPNDEDLIEGESWGLGFIAQYNSNGDFVNVKGIGGGIVAGMKIQVAPSGNVYAAGTFCAKASVEGNYHGLSFFKRDDNPNYITSQGKFEVSPENEDLFLLKYNESGAIQWLKTVNSSTYNIMTDIVLDSDENIYFSGSFNGSNVDFDTDNNSSFDTKSAVSKGSGFLAKYKSENGDLVWLNTIEGGDRSRVRSISTKGENLIVCGDFEGAVSIGNNALNTPELNPFIAIVNTSNGNYLVANKMEKTKASSLAKVTIAPDGKIHYLGFEATDFSGEYSIESIFMGEASSDVIAVSELVRISLTENACDSYSTPSGKIHTLSGIYSDTIFNSAADTIYTINLTVNHSTTSTFNESSCGDYTSPSGKVFSDSGTYLDTIANNAGCDSIITIELVVSKLNAELTVENNTLTATVPNAIYQWINCIDNTPIDGETSQKLTTNINGSYAVIIDNSICKDTSDCSSITITSIPNSINTDEVQVFPNPIKDVIHIKCSQNIHQIELYDKSGRLVLCEVDKVIVNIGHLLKGMYLLKLQTDKGEVFVRKVIKN